MLYSPIFTNQIVYFCLFFIIIFYQFAYNNKNNIINVSLSVYSFFNVVIKKIFIVKKIENKTKQQIL